MKTFDKILLALSILAALAMFVLIINWGVNLKSTTMLWKDGQFSGWFELILIAIIAAVMMLLPAALMISEWKIEKERTNKKNNRK